MLTNIQVWRPRHKKDMYTLERMQTMRLRVCQVEVFEMLNGYENIYIIFFLTKGT